jgi:hypothetical protein
MVVDCELQSPYGLPSFTVYYHGIRKHVSYRENKNIN